MADYMAQGRTVKIDGLGTFYYTSNASGNGKATAEEVDASQITGVRVRFIPEARKSGSSRSMVRSLISNDIFWMELPEGAQTTDPDTGGGTEPGGEEEERPGGL